MYEQAKSVSQYVLGNCSGSDQCIWAQRDIILCDIGLRNQPAAQAGLEKLVRDCTQDGRLPYVLNDIARIYREARLHEQARPISQYILDHYSGNDQCIWAQRDIILCDKDLGNLDAAQVGLQKLLKNYADDGHLPYALNEIASQYRQAQMYEQSKAISQHVLDNYPDSDQRLWAQRDIALSDLASGHLESASATTQQLVSKFAKQPGVVWAVGEVADGFSRLGQHEQARNLFAFNLGSGFDPDDTIWSLRGFVNESIALNDDGSIDAGVKRLLSEYSASKNLPMAANHIAREVSRTGHPQASQSFQYVIDKYPGDEQTIFARICMGHIYLQRGQDSQAEAIYQKILTDYANHPRLAEAVSLMAEGYYEQAFRQPGSDEQKSGGPLSEYTKTHIQKALDKWDLVIGRLPPRADVTAMSCFYAATAYYQLGDYPKALQYCTQMVERWPEHEEAWRAQMLAHKIYKRQMADGAIPEPQAMVAMTQSFQQLLQKYPASPVASIARQWLQQYGTKSEGGER
jgi:tetratricopeptide (TPR) repeat protein